jgi:hypothetical protein
MERRRGGVGDLQRLRREFSGEPARSELHATSCPLWMQALVIHRFPAAARTPRQRGSGDRGDSPFAMRVVLVPDPLGKSSLTLVWLSGSQSPWAGTERGGSRARLGALGKGSRPAASTDSDGFHQASHLTWDAPSLPTPSITTILPLGRARVNRLLRGLAAPLRPAMVAAAPSAPLKRYAGRVRSRRAATRTAPPCSWSRGGVAVRETVPHAGIRLVPAVSRR